MSDVHVDHKENLEWLEALPAPPRPPGRANVLLLAGDVSHDVALLRRALGALRARFDRVAFIHGNHELWVKGGAELHAGARDSAAKLAAVTALCDELGVDTEPFLIGRLWVVPVLAWHHKVRRGCGACGGLKRSCAGALCAAVRRGAAAL